MTLLGDDAEGAVQLLHAIAVAAAQGLAGHARGVEAGVEGPRGGDVAVRERQDVMPVDQVLEDVSPERAVAGLEVAGGDEEGVSVKGPVTGAERAERRSALVLQSLDQRRELLVAPEGARRGSR